MTFWGIFSNAALLGTNTVNGPSTSRAALEPGLVDGADERRQVRVVGGRRAGTVVGHPGDRRLALAGNVRTSCADRRGRRT